MLVYWINKTIGGSDNPELHDIPIMKEYDLCGLVCLDKQPVSKEVAFFLDIPFLHLPITTKLPTINEINSFITFYKENCTQGKKRILIHNKDAFGLVNILQASFLIIINKLSPNNAIEKIQLINPDAFTEDAKIFLNNIVNQIK